MNKKQIQRRRRYLQSQWQKLDEVEDKLRNAPKAPPVVPPQVLKAPAQAPLPQNLWHFQHTHPDLPNAILYCVVQAENIANARGKAYLLAEAFTQNVIGSIKANAPTQLPKG